MPNPPSIPLPEADRLAQRFSQRLDELRGSLAATQPATLAERTGAEWLPEQTCLRLVLWGRVYEVRLPEFVAYLAGGDAPANPLDQATLMYYLATADGAPVEERWISFADLPDGRFYNQAFQGYTGQELAHAFADDRFAFEQACQKLGGHPFPLGDAAYSFQPLPRVPMLVVYWQGDEDFDASCQVLFDASARHYLPTDAYAILGSTLTRMLKKNIHH